jgi:glycosyltransferase involved in cell wall biosynthesis
LIFQTTPHYDGADAHMKRLDTLPLELKADEILGFMRVRNEHLRLPWCLDYHRQLGVDRFFVVDNASTDGTADYLLSRDDVHLFWTDAQYGKSHSGMDWINPLLAEYGSGHWTVTVDADELLIYPQIERLDLRGLTEFLRRSGADSLDCVMIDMYGAGSIKDTRYERGQDFLHACPFFDAEPLEGMRGGARQRLFWRHSARDSMPPYLKKTPLVRWRSGVEFKVSTHEIRDVRSASVSGALLHFKLFHDFHEKVARGVEEGQYWNGSSQYRAYLAGMEANPDLAPTFEHTHRFQRSTQLVELGFMRASLQYDQFIESTLGESSAGADADVR